jgi:NAD(P)-dependent dehydrogenase (short-subunit alcohol dehydrogenase family)
VWSWLCLFINHADGEDAYMEIAGHKVLVTGANRGLGRHLVEQLRDRGATVYAAARNPDSVDVAGVTPIQLDVTNEASITAAAETVGGVSILINNAGSSTGSSLLTGPIDDIRLEMDTHYFGTLLVTRAFAGQLAEEGRGAVLNILSVLSWFSFPAIGAYCAAKSAEWSMTNALRQELSAQGTVVSALHVGYMDTDMAVGVKGPKSDPAAVARIALDGIEAGELEILADEISLSVRSSLAGGVAALYPSPKASPGG